MENQTSNINSDVKPEPKATFTIFMFDVEWNDDRKEFETSKKFVTLSLGQDIPDDYDVIKDFINFLAQNPQIDLNYCLKKFIIKITSRISYNIRNIEKIFPIYDSFVNEKKIDINQIIDERMHNNNALMWAIANGDCDFSLYLIQKLNANPFVKDSNQKNALHFIIMKSRKENKINDYQNQLPLFDEILKHRDIKNHINDQDENGNATLHIAIARGDLKYINGLINAGATLDIKNNSGQTPSDILNLSLDERCKIARGFDGKNNIDNGMYSIINNELFRRNKDIISAKLSSPNQSIKIETKNPELKRGNNLSLLTLITNQFLCNLHSIQSPTKMKIVTHHP